MTPVPTGPADTLPGIGGGGAPNGGAGVAAGPAAYTFPIF